MYFITKWHFRSQTWRCREYGKQWRKKEGLGGAKPHRNKRRAPRAFAAVLGTLLLAHHHTPPSLFFFRGHPSFLAAHLNACGWGAGKRTHARACAPSLSPSAHSATHTLAQRRRAGEGGNNKNLGVTRKCIKQLKGMKKMAVSCVVSLSLSLSTNTPLRKETKETESGWGGGCS